MKSITFLSLLILFSLSFENEIPLTPFVIKFLPKINELVTTPLVATKSFKKTTATASITFRELTQDNIVAILEQSDLVHLTVTNVKADAKAQLKTKILKKTLSITLKGEVDTNIDMRFKVGTKKVDGKSVFTATITEFKTSTDVKLNIGKIKLNLFKLVPKDLKTLLEEKILDKFLQKKLQTVVDAAIEKLSG